MKRFAAFLLTLLLVFTLCSCGKKHVEEDPVAPGVEEHTDEEKQPKKPIPEVTKPEDTEDPVTDGETAPVPASKPTEKADDSSSGGGQSGGGYHGGGGHHRHHPTGGGGEDTPTVQDLTITEEKTVSGGTYKDVIIDAAVGNGTVTLDKVTIEGQLIVRGGGSNSIKVVGCDVSAVVLDKDTSGENAQAPRLELTGTEVQSVEVSQPAIIEATDTASAVQELSAKDSVTIKGEKTEIASVIVPTDAENDVTLTVNDASVAKVEVNKPVTIETSAAAGKTPVAAVEAKADVTVSGAATNVGTVTVPADAGNDVKLKVEDAKVNSVSAEAPVTIEANEYAAKIDSVEAKADVTVAGENTKIDTITVPETVTSKPAINVSAGSVNTVEAKSEASVSGGSNAIANVEAAAPVEVNSAAVAKVTVTVNVTVTVTGSSSVEVAVEVETSGSETVAIEAVNATVNVSTTQEDAPTVKVNDAPVTHIHKWVESGRVNAGCKTPGSITYTCNEPGCAVNTKTEVIPAKGHTEVVIPAVDPTCTAAGHTAGKKCAVCGEIIVETSETKALGHDFTGSYVSDETAHWHVCSYCGETDTKHTHTYSTTDCTVAARCSECGYQKAAGVHTWNAGTVQAAASCDTAGSMLYTCTSCAATKTETIPALGHTYGTPVFSWNGTNCTAARTCTREGCSHADSAIAQVSSYELKAPSCTENGVTVYTATVVFDGKTYSATTNATVNATGHTGVKQNGQAATCEENGWNDYYKCSKCQKLFSDADCKNEITNLSVWKTGDGKLAALGHTYGTTPTWNWTGYTSATATFTCTRGCGHTETVNAAITSEVTTAAGCDSTGTRTYTATVTFGGQDYSNAKTETLAVLGHTGVKQSGQAATCEVDGWKDYYECSVCHKLFSDSTCKNEITDLGAWKIGDGKVQALGHNYGTPTYTWDGDSCTATRVCANDDTHKVTETKTGTYVKDTDATCTVNEKGHYEVTFNDTQFGSAATAANSVENANSALDHSWAEAWSSDATGHWHVCTRTGCTATSIKESHVPGDAATETTPQTCTACGYELAPATGHLCVNHLTAHEANAATCTTAGNSAYWSCTCGKYYSDAEAKSEIMANSWVIAALNHAYGTTPEWDWTGYTSATATFTCTREECGHTETVDATITNRVTTAAGNDTEGVRTYTATVSFDGKTYTNTKTEAIPALIQTVTTAEEFAAGLTNTARSGVKVNGDITLTADTTIPAGKSVEIVSSKTLTVSGELRVYGTLTNHGAITGGTVDAFGGTVVNDGTIQIGDGCVLAVEKGSTLTNTGTITGGDGSEINIGDYIYANSTVTNTTTGIDNSGAVTVPVKKAAAVFDSTKLQTALNGNYDYIIPSGTGTTGTNAVTLSSLTVPAGKLLILKETVDNGTNKLHNSFTLNGDMTVAKNGLLISRGGASLNVASGFKLTANGYMRLENLTVDGHVYTEEGGLDVTTALTVNADGVLEIGSGSSMNYTGTDDAVINGTLIKTVRNVNGFEENVTSIINGVEANDTLYTLVFWEDVTVTGDRTVGTIIPVAGTLKVAPGGSLKYKEILSGSVGEDPLNGVILGNKTEQPDANGYYTLTAAVETVTNYADFAAALENDSVTAITVNADITVPSGDEWKQLDITKPVVIADGKTFTVAHYDGDSPKSQLIMNEVVIKDGGSLTLGDDAVLTATETRSGNNEMFYRYFGRIYVENGGMLDVSAGTVTSGSAIYYDYGENNEDPDSRNIVVGQTQPDNIAFVVWNEEQLRAAMADNKCTGGIEADTDIELTNDLSVDKYLLINDFQKLTVPENVTLTVPEGQTLQLSGQLYVFDGTVINHGTIYGYDVIDVYGGTLENDGIIEGMFAPNDQGDIECISLLAIEKGGTLRNFVGDIESATKSGVINDDINFVDYYYAEDEFLCNWDVLDGDTTLDIDGEHKMVIAAVFDPNKMETAMGKTISITVPGEDDVPTQIDTPKYNAVLPCGTETQSTVELGELNIPEGMLLILRKNVFDGEETYENSFEIEDLTIETGRQMVTVDEPEVTVTGKLTTYGFTAFDKLTIASGGHVDCEKDRLMVTKQLTIEDGGKLEVGGEGEFFYFGGEDGLTINGELLATTRYMNGLAESNIFAQSEIEGAEPTGTLRTLVITDDTLLYGDHTVDAIVSVSGELYLFNGSTLKYKSVFDYNGNPITSTPWTAAGPDGDGYYTVIGDFDGTVVDSSTALENALKDGGNIYLLPLEKSKQIDVSEDFGEEEGTLFESQYRINKILSNKPFTCDNDVNLVSLGGEEPIAVFFDDGFDVTADKTLTFRGLNVVAAADSTVYGRVEAHNGVLIVQGKNGDATLTISNTGTVVIGGENEWAQLAIFGEESGDKIVNNGTIENYGELSFDCDPDKGQFEGNEPLEFANYADVVRDLYRDFGEMPNMDPLEDNDRENLVDVYPDSQEMYHEDSSDDEALDGFAWLIKNGIIDAYDEDNNPELRPYHYVTKGEVKNLFTAFAEKVLATDTDLNIDGGNGYICRTDNIPVEGEDWCTSERNQYFDALREALNSLQSTEVADEAEFMEALCNPLLTEVHVTGDITLNGYYYKDGQHVNKEDDHDDGPSVYLEAAGRDRNEWREIIVEPDATLTVAEDVKMDINRDVKLRVVNGGQLIVKGNVNVFGELDPDENDESRITVDRDNDGNISYFGDAYFFGERLLEVAGDYMDMENLNIPEGYDRIDGWDDNEKVTCLVAYGLEPESDGENSWWDFGAAPEYGQMITILTNIYRDATDEPNNNLPVDVKVGDEGWPNENDILDNRNVEELLSKFSAALPKMNDNRTEIVLKHTEDENNTDGMTITGKTFTQAITVRCETSDNDWGGELNFVNCEFSNGITLTYNGDYDYRVNFHDNCTGTVTTAYPESITGDENRVRIAHPDGMTITAEAPTAFEMNDGCLCGTDSFTVNGLTINGNGCENLEVDVRKDDTTPTIEVTGSEDGSAIVLSGSYTGKLRVSGCMDVSGVALGTTDSWIELANWYDKENGDSAPNSSITLGDNDISINDDWGEQSFTGTGTIHVNNGPKENLQLTINDRNLAIPHVFGGEGSYAIFLGLADVNGVTFEVKQGDDALTGKTVRYDKSENAEGNDGFDGSNVEKTHLEKDGENTWITDPNNISLTVTVDGCTIMYENLRYNGQ